MSIDKSVLNKVLCAQRNELTEHQIYKSLAGTTKHPEHRQVLERIAAEELAHSHFLKTITNQTVTADPWKRFYYVTISRILGLNFGLRLMEREEDIAQHVYTQLKGTYPGMENLIHDEKKHEMQLLDMIDEERLKYIGSMVLGLNDALVELTGALTGLTLALQNTRLIAIVGLITGIAASLSMAASEYLSTKQEDKTKNPLKASLYTGTAYVGTVVFLIFPYFLYGNIFLALGQALFNALLIIIVFTFYISVAQGLSFRKHFLEMAGLSMFVAGINFAVGLLVRKVFGIDI